MTKTVEKFIRIVALDSLYSRVPFIFAPVKLVNGKFLTGQESILTEQQMLGKEKLTKAIKDELLMGEDPYIINPDDTYALNHARKFDLSCKVDDKGKVFQYLNPKDYAEFNFFSAQVEVIEDRKAYQRMKHFFYIEDKDAEAQHKITTEDTVFDAQAFVRTNTSIKRLRDIAMLLSHLSPKFTINVDSTTITRLQARLYDACKTMPETVLLCKGSGKDDLNHEKLFVLKALNLREIQFYKGSYYHGHNRQDYIGDNFNKVIDWVKDPINSSQVERIGVLVKEFEDKPIK